MIYEINISSYFEEHDKNVSKNDFETLMDLRDALNSQDTLYEQIEFIQKWRNVKKNREFDYRVLGISLNAIIDRKYVSFKGEIDSSLKFERNKSRNRLNKINYEDIVENKIENNQKKLNLNQIAYDHNFHSLSFILRNFIFFLKISIIILIVFFTLSLIFYFSGIKNSFGSSPFVFIESEI